MVQPRPQHPQQPGTMGGGEECSPPRWGSAVAPWGGTLQLPSEANRLMLPSLLSSMSNSLCLSFSY